MSLLSLWLGMYFCIASVVGLVLSIVGMACAKKHRLNGLAVAGLVLGIISTLLWGIIWIAAASFLSSLM